MARSKTILVTGGAGFIGSHLCEFLLKKNCKVICVDSLLTGDLKNISHLLKNKNFKFVKKDITKPFKLKTKLHQIYNLASPASPIDFKNLAVEILMVNSVGTKNMLDLALKNKATFLETSTSEAYGQPLKHPQNEDYWGNVNPVGVRSCYDEGKRFSEALVTSYRRLYGLDTKIARIFNTYGPRMRPQDGRVTPNFIMQSLKNKPLTVYGNGKQTRSFCYVSDMVSGLCKMMNSKQPGPINIGNPKEITVLELARRIIKITDSGSKVVFKDLPKDDPARRRPDIKRARKFLKWNPEVGLNKGLKETIEWFRNS